MGTAAWPSESSSIRAKKPSTRSPARSSIGSSTPATTRWKASNTRVAVERKSLADFVHTVIHDFDRFAAELEKLSHMDAACVVVEADLDEVLRGLHADALRRVSPHRSWGPPSTSRCAGTCPSTGAAPGRPPAPSPTHSCARSCGWPSSRTNAIASSQEVATLAETLSGTVYRTYFTSPKFSAGVLQTDIGDMVRFCGPFCANEGEIVVLEGRWKDDPKYGRQFQVQQIRYELPQTAEGLVQYLARHPAFVGIGEATARKIVAYAASPEQLDRLIRLDLDTLHRQLRIPKGTLESLREAWIANSADNEVRSFLAGFGLTPHQIQTLIDTFGNGVVGVLRSDPYQIIPVRQGLRIQEGRQDRPRHGHAQGPRRSPGGRPAARRQRRDRLRPHLDFRGRPGHQGERPAALGHARQPQADRGRGPATAGSRCPDCHREGDHHALDSWRPRA